MVHTIPSSMLNMANLDRSSHRTLLSSQHQKEVREVVALDRENHHCTPADQQTGAGAATQHTVVTARPGGQTETQKLPTMKLYVALVIIYLPTISLT